MARFLHPEDSAFDHLYNSVTNTFEGCWRKVYLLVCPNLQCQLQEEFQKSRRVVEVADRFPQRVVLIKVRKWNLPIVFKMIYRTWVRVFLLPLLSRNTSDDLPVFDLRFLFQSVHRGSYCRMLTELRWEANRSSTCPVHRPQKVWLLEPHVQHKCCVLSNSPLQSHRCGCRIKSHVTSAPRLDLQEEEKKRATGRFHSAQRSRDRQVITGTWPKTPKDAGAAAHSQIKTIHLVVEGTGVICCTAWVVCLGGFVQSQVCLSFKKKKTCRESKSGLH